MTQAFFFLYTILIHNRKIMGNKGNNLIKKSRIYAFFRFPIAVSGNFAGNAKLPLFRFHGLQWKQGKKQFERRTLSSFPLYIGKKAMASCWYSAVSMPYAVPKCQISLTRVYALCVCFSSYLYHYHYFIEKRKAHRHKHPKRLCATGVFSHAFLYAKCFNGTPRHEPMLFWHVP